MVLEKNPNARLIAATIIVPLCWMACSSGLILLNQHLMMDKGVHMKRCVLCVMLRVLPAFPP